jgi:hypothetical protein
MTPENQHSGIVDLTKEETNELLRRPIRREWTDFTESQLQIRIQIARKWSDWLIYADSTLSEELREMCISYPMWKFYRGESSTTIKRAYGACNFVENDYPCVRTITAFIGRTCDGISVDPGDDMIAVGRWNETQLDNIRMNDSPGIFADPLGFWICVTDALNGKSQDESQDKYPDQDISTDMETDKSNGEEKVPVPLFLTIEEKAELSARPVRNEYTAFTEDQLRMRIQIAQKQHKWLLNADQSMSPEFREIYMTRPMWKFYINAGKTVIKRVYGVCKRMNGTLAMRTVACFIGMTNDKNHRGGSLNRLPTPYNDTLGGVPVDETVAIDRWEPEHLAYIQLNDAPGMFADPLGFLLAVKNHAK